MSTKETGGPAFPYAFPDKREDDYNVCQGISIRDYFAAKAMQGMLANPNQDYAPLTIKSQSCVVVGAYDMADAMLKYRKSCAKKVAEDTCTCPSGDGSLRWPCPVHQVRQTS